MIRFFKVFINLLYGIFTMGAIAIVVWGANWMVNTGGQSYDVPNLISNSDDDTEKTIYFADIVEFNIVSISNAHKSHEVFLGNEVNGQETILWGAIPIGWFNRSLSWTKNVFVAVLSPSYEIEQMDRYRHAFFLIEEPVEVGEDATGRYIEIDPVGMDENNYGDYDIYGIIYRNQLDPLVTYETFSSEDITRYGVGNNAQNLFEGEATIDFNFKNEIIKFNKYNGSEYDQFEKFLVNKPVAKWAFAEILIIFALTVFVVYQNPIDFTKNNKGVNEMDRSFLPRLPMPKRRERRHSKGQ